MVVDNTQDRHRVVDLAMPVNYDIRKRNSEVDILSQASAKRTAVWIFRKPVKETSKMSRIFFG